MKKETHRAIFFQPTPVYLGGIIAGMGLGLLVASMLIGKYHLSVRHEVFLLAPWLLIVIGGLIARGHKMKQEGQDNN